MLDEVSLRAERRRFLVAAGGLWQVPAAGVLFWGSWGVAGTVWSPERWATVVVAASAAATPGVALLLRALLRRLSARTPLAAAILPAMAPALFSVALSGAVFRAEPSLVPLLLVVGFAGHWPVVGWLLGTRVYAVHALARVGLAVAIWVLLPAGRFTALPLVTAGVYAVTAAAIVREVGRARAAVRGPAG